MKFDTNTSVHDIVFVFFDFETTGLNYNVDKVIEIGAVKSSTEQVQNIYQSFVNIGESISPQVTAINNITDDMLVGAPSIKQVLQYFLSFIEGAILVAHNVGFDFRFLNAELSRNKFNNISDIQLIDTLSLARKVFPNLQSYKLEDLSKHANLTVHQHHRALDDAYACRGLLLHYINQLSFLGELPLSELLL